MDKRNIAGVNNDTTLISLGNTSSGSIALIPIVPIVPAVSNLLDLGTSSQRWKTVFSYGLNASGDVTPSASISYNLGSSGNRWGTLYTTTFDCTDNCAFGGIPYPKTNNTYDLGTSSQRWKTVFSYGLNASGDVTPSASISYNLGSSSNRWGTLYTTTFDCTDNCAFGGIPYPKTSNTYDLGTSSQRWKTVFSYGLNASGDVTPSASISYNLGSSSNRWGTLYTVAFDCTDNCAFGGIPYPKTNNTYDLGTSSQRWKDTYVVNVNASGNLLPSVDNASDLGSTSKRWRNIYRVPQYLEATKTTGSATSGSAVNMTWDTITTNTISGLTYNAGTGVFTYVGADILLNVSVYALILFNTTGVRNVTITSTAGLLSKSYVGASSASDTVLNCSTLVPLTTGQQLWFVHFQNSGSTLTTTGRCTMYLV